jgi:hypothetical protein
MLKTHSRGKMAEKKVIKVGEKWLNKRIIWWNKLEC